MRERKIAVGFDTSSQPCDGFGVRAELYLGPAHKYLHQKASDIARGETKSLEYMAFGLVGVTHEKFGHTDNAMSVCEIAIQH